MAVISMIFSTIFKRSIENFPIYYLTGFIIWNMFTLSTNTAMTALVDNKQLLIKVKLPMLIFPISRVLTALVNLGYSMVAYVVMLIVFPVAVCFGDFLYIVCGLCVFWRYQTPVFCVDYSMDVLLSDFLSSRCH